MRNEIVAISKLFVANLRYNKIALVFNLVFPTVYYLYNYYSGGIDAQNMTQQVVYFWTYIIFVSILNFMILPMITYRESGIYKQLWLIISRKNAIMLALFLVCMTVIALELIIFNLAVMVTSGAWQPELLISSLLTLILFGPINYMILTLLLVLKIVPESLSVLAAILIFILFYLVTLDSTNVGEQMLYMLNPVKYLLVASTWMLGLITGQGFDGLVTLQLVVVGVVMCAIGVFSLKNFNVKPLINQM